MIGSEYKKIKQVLSENLIEESDITACIYYDENNTEYTIEFSLLKDFLSKIDVDYRHIVFHNRIVIFGKNWYIESDYSDGSCGNYWQFRKFPKIESRKEIYSTEDLMRIVSTTYFYNGKFYNRGIDISTIHLYDQDNYEYGSMKFSECGLYSNWNIPIINKDEFNGKINYPELTNDKSAVTCKYCIELFD